MLPADIATDERLPLIIVGAGKTLQLRNVVISGAMSLPSCLHLGPGAPPPPGPTARAQPPR